MNPPSYDPELQKDQYRPPVQAFHVDAEFAPLMGYEAEPVAFRVPDGSIKRFYIDWVLFLLGFNMFLPGLPFIVGAFLPLCRRPQFKDSWQKTAWALNVIFASLAAVIFVLLILFWVSFLIMIGGAVGAVGAAAAAVSQDPTLNSLPQSSSIGMDTTFDSSYTAYQG